MKFRISDFLASYNNDLARVEFYVDHSIWYWKLGQLTVDARLYTDYIQKGWEYFYDSLVQFITENRFGIKFDHTTWTQPLLIESVNQLGFCAARITTIYHCAYELRSCKMPDEVRTALYSIVTALSLYMTSFNDILQKFLNENPSVQAGYLKLSLDLQNSFFESEHEYHERRAAMQLEIIEKQLADSLITFNKITDIVNNGNDLETDAISYQPKSLAGIGESMLLRASACIDSLTIYGSSASHIPSLKRIRNAIMELNQSMKLNLESTAMNEIKYSILARNIMRITLPASEFNIKMKLLSLTPSIQSELHIPESITNEIIIINNVIRKKLKEEGYDLRSHKRNPF